MTTAVKNEQEQKVIDGVRKQLYIGGQWRGGAEDGTLPVEDPSTGETLCEIADATPRELVRFTPPRIPAPARSRRAASAQRWA